jgi:peroxiredoxin
MRKHIVFKILLLLSFLYLYQSVYAAECPAKGEKFPDIIISAPQSQTEKDYLGLATTAPFKLSQIKADIVIVEVFSMYCPYCQKEAPAVNDLFTIINKQPDIKDKIKIIGIGAGNTLFEVDFFRNRYNVPFPLFTDESFSIHKTVGEVRTPYFFVLKMNPDGSNKIIYSKVGTIDEPAQFLDLILKESGIK